MRAKPSLANRLTMAALISALAAVLMVAVGPGLAEKPDDAGTPNENASEQAQESTSDDSSDPAASEESADEAADTTASEDATEVAATDTEATEEHVPPGQEKKEDSSGEEGSTETDAGVLGATSGPGNSANAHVNEDTSQTGLPRGQSADECTNKHQGADPQQGGANQNPGPYDNTCDGRASENGSGGGNATGRPCMGCVGNADDKNPRGQLPNGKDHNAGYECDRNKGVGQGNPAHTDCSTSTVRTDICHFDADGTARLIFGLTNEALAGHIPGHSRDFVVNSAADQARCKKTDEPPLFKICHFDSTTGEAVVLSNQSQAQVDSHIPGHADDFLITNNGNSKKCEKKTELCPDGSPMPPGGSKDCPKKIYVCHSGNGKHYVLIHISFNGLHGHEDHEFDKIGVPADTNPEDCADDEPENVRICHKDSATGDFSEITIDEDDVDTHKSHGDIYPVPTGGCPEDEETVVCHLNNDGSYTATTIDLDDLATHKGHGDIHPVPSGGCPVDDERFQICDVSTDDFDVVSNLTRAQVTAALAADSRDFEINDSSDLSRCDDDERRRPDRDTICHSLDGESWSVITDDENDIDDHLDDHPFDFPVPRGTSEEECEDEEEFCPEGTDLEGEAMPDDGECNLPSVVNPGARLCPADSDMAGLPVPNGVLANCWPAAVLPSLQERPVVAPARIPGRPPTDAQPGVLPFTGASVLAFLVLALQLIAAGALIMRGKKA